MKNLEYYVRPVKFLSEKSIEEPLVTILFFPRT